ncbi:hypothetical protein FIBSPDRAFT_969801 [Athelia psychrophila]|uniref:Uncharacterized protein n=1 Tax=Athelia psychrophila TaxID=1759441 RepID=A0A167T6G9_9AGAM|nr:hypothetical protein FIBSPDRAFT_969801 [Fibularhizoctonia sp. CBS 109695]
MSASKHPQNDENMFRNYEPATPAIKKPCLKALPLTPLELLQRSLANDHILADLEKEHITQTTQVKTVLDYIADTGYRSLHDIVRELLSTHDQHILSTVIKMLGQHSDMILNMLMVKGWENTVN